MNKNIKSFLYSLSPIAVAIAIFFSGGYPPLASAYTGLQFSGSVVGNAIVSPAFDTASIGETCYILNNPYDPIYGASAVFSAPLATLNWSTVNYHDSGSGNKKFMVACDLDSPWSATNPHYYIEFTVSAFGVGPTLTTTGIKKSSYITAGVPTAGVNTGSTSVTYFADYFYSTNPPYPMGTPTTINAFIERIDIPDGGTNRSCTIVSNVLSSCTGNIDLIEGGLYQISWSMRDSSNRPVLIVNPYQFGVVNTPNMPFLIPEPIDTSSCSSYTLGFQWLCDIGVFLFVPSDDVISQFKSLTLRDRAPFVYLYQFSDGISRLFAPCDPTCPTIGIKVNTQGQDVYLLSTEMIEDFAYTSWIRNLLAIFLYFSTAVALYYSILRVFNKSDSTTK